MIKKTLYSKNKQTNHTKKYNEWCKMGVKKCNMLQYWVNANVLQENSNFGNTKRCRNK